VLIEFTRAARGASYATIHRRDGVVVRLAGFSVKYRVPHDLAHAVAERELGLADGIFGSIAAGALFSSCRVIAGRQRPDAAGRGERILRANSRAIGFSELLGGALHAAVEHTLQDGLSLGRKVRADWGILTSDPCPYTDARLGRAESTLDSLGREWELTELGGCLVFVWPDRLTSPAPPAPRARPAESRRRAR
jgi:hypothetical protein